MKIDTCARCGITHPQVECQGIHFCPNPICRSCGATNLKRDLLDVEEENFKFYVNLLDLERLAHELIADIENHHTMERVAAKGPDYSFPITSDKAYHNVLVSALHDRVAFIEAIKRSLDFQCERITGKETK